MKTLRNILIFFLITSYFAQAQTDDYKFEKISIKDGLSHSNVFTILQDQLGYMWFGTQDGLNKYDGYEFTIYRHEPSNPNSLSTGNFGKIYQDSSGIFWFGTFGGGLDRFDPKTNTFTNYSNKPNDPKSLSNNQVLFVFEDSHNGIWVGTTSGGLNKFNKKEQNFTRFQPNPDDPLSFSSLRAKCMCETKDGTLWFGTGNGLNKYNPSNNTFTLYNHNTENINSISSNNIQDSYANEVSSISIQHLYADEDGIIWIACRETGISKFDPKTGIFKHYIHNPNDPSSISNNNAEFILKDSYGNFWIGTYQGGLNKFDPNTEKFIHFKHDPNNAESISHNRIEYIFEDASRNLWIATRGGGINKLDLKPKKFNNIIHNPDDINSLPHPSVMAIDYDKSGNIWIGTDGGGISKYNPVTNTFTHFQNNPFNTNSLSVNRVWSVLVDREDVIWVGTYRGGLNRFEYKNGKYTITRYLGNRGVNSSLSNNQITAIVEDQEGTIWIATANGLNELIKSGNPENYTFKQYFQNTIDSLNFIDNYISNLYLDSQDRLWIGSYTGGLFQFLPKKKEFIKYSPLNLENSEFKQEIHVLIIFEDSNKNLLLGTESNGIIKFDLENKSFSQHPKNKELLSNMIMGMLEDNIGNLWISTSRGLSKYSPWNNKLNNYTYIDGLESSGFNRNAVLKYKDGKMFFGSNAALTYFYPLEVSTNPYVPKIVITDFKILNESKWNNNLLTYEKIRYENEEIELVKDDYFFTFEFAALDYTIPQQNQYKYMLDGLDDDWIEASNNRVATYTNLNPGSYTFKVIGSNNDKVWNENPTELKIRVIPPFYKTKWFIFSIIVIGILIIISYVKIRERNLIKEKEILEGKIQERTIEISLQKEELKSQAENLEKTNIELENQQEKLEKLVHERTADLEIAKEKAEESDRLKSAFLANMSHEIRTPMNAIIGFSDILNEQNIDDNTKEKLTGLIIKNSYSLLTLIDDIIDISKIESDQLEIKEENCSVNLIFNDLLIDFEAVIQSNNQVSLKVSEEHLHNPLVIKSDPYRLTQILRNLISNAIKFTEKGTVEFGYNLDNLDYKNQILFYIKDTGIGLSPEQQKQIFSRFIKIENNKRKIYRGAGLGLAIAKNLVELLGGEIKVESEIENLSVGKAGGSTFYFSIPFKPIDTTNKEEPQKKKPTSKYNWSNKTILIAEDEESNFKFLKMIISKTSAEILWATTGKQVIEFCSGSKRIDLILMDIKMPEMDGLEAIREIRKYKNQTPIIVQTAYSMPGDRDLSFDAGADDFISKPIRTEKLLSIIDKHLNSA